MHECDRRTDRQTDGRTDRFTITKTVQRIASHGKNWKWILIFDEVTKFDGLLCVDHQVYFSYNHISIKRIIKRPIFGIKRNEFVLFLFNLFYSRSRDVFTLKTTRLPVALAYLCGINSAASFRWSPIKTHFSVAMQLSCLSHSLSSSPLFSLLSSFAQRFPQTIVLVFVGLVTDLSK